MGFVVEAMRIGVYCKGFDISIPAYVRTAFDSISSADPTKRKWAISAPTMIATSILFNSESAFWTRRVIGYPFIAISKFEDRWVHCNRRFIVPNRKLNWPHWFSKKCSQLNIIFDLTVLWTRKAHMYVPYPQGTCPPPSFSCWGFHSILVFHNTERLQLTSDSQFYIASKRVECLLFQLVPRHLSAFLRSLIECGHNPSYKVFGDGHLREISPEDFAEMIKFP